MKEDYAEYKADNHEDKGEQMKQTNFNVYLMSFCKMFLIIFTVAAFSTGCSSSSSNQTSTPSPPVSLIPVSTQYAASVWPRLHQNDFNNGQSMVDTSSNTGALKWTFYAGAKVDSSPAIGADGTIYIGCENGNLYALDPSDGTQKWAYQTGGIIYTSSPAVAADGTIYIGSQTGFFAINPDGSLKWSYGTGDTEAGSPAIDANGIIYVPSYDYNLYEFNPDGVRRFTVSTGNSMAGAPAIDPNGTVYIGSNDKTVYALGDGFSIMWTFKTKNGMGMPAIGPDGYTLYVGGLDGYLYSLDGYTGKENWKLYLHNPIEATPAIGTDGTIYVGTTAPNSSTNDTVYAVSPSGKKLWGFRANDQLDSSAVVGYDGTIYIGGEGSDFIALTSAGKMKWIIGGISNFLTINSTPAIGEDGTIYFGADDGYVYAIH